MADTNFINGTVVVPEWLNDVNEVTYKATQQKTGAVDRMGVDKVTEIPSLDDFNASMANFEAAADGGLAILPRTTYSFGNYELTQDGVYLNGSTNLLSSFLHEVGETPGNNMTRHLTLTSTTGTNIGKRRFGQMFRMSSQGAGSTIAVDGTGDFAKATIATKLNYSGSPTAGEIGGNYTVVRQGGASGTLNDCSAELYNVATHSNSFACLTEGVTSKISGSTITDAVRVQTGYLNKGTADMGGVAVSIDEGTASNIDYREVQSGATATNLFKYVNHNAAVGRQELYTISGNGNHVAVMRDNLGNTLGNNVIPQQWSVFNNNKDSVVFQLIRNAAGSDYTTSEWRLQRTIDATTGGGLIFNYHSTRGHSASLGANGVSLLTQTSNLYLGFNGATPIAKPALPAAATDLASAISLVNAIRSALINYGLAT